MSFCMLSSQTAPDCEFESRSAAGVRPDAVRPSVLVLLAARNGSRWIREQMDSILAQAGVDVRIAVRDDCSTDGTRWELGRFAEDERVGIIASPAASGSAARNFLALIGENAADGFDFVAFADQDDLWNRDKLVRACRMLAGNRSAGYSSATVAAWEDGRERVIRPSGAPTASDFLFEGAGQGCTFVLSAEFYERVRTFLAAHPDLTRRLHYHDWLMYALARSWGLGWCFDPSPSMKYRQHAGNDTGARGTLDGIVRRLSLVRQGWYRTQLHAIAGLCVTAAPANATVASWYTRFMRPDCWRRRLQIARFCLRGGRRRTRDNMIAVFAALSGWI
jgi:rhamnosyltransferase